MRHALKRGQKMKGKSRIRSERERETAKRGGRK